MQAYYKIIESPCFSGDHRQICRRSDICRLLPVQKGLKNWAKCNFYFFFFCRLPHERSGLYYKVSPTSSQSKHVNKWQNWLNLLILILRDWKHCSQSTVTWMSPVSGYRTGQKPPRSVSLFYIFLLQLLPNKASAKEWGWFFFIRTSLLAEGQDTQNRRGFRHTSNVWSVQIILASKDVYV
jgi:hypothetical protein